MRKRRSNKISTNIWRNWVINVKNSCTVEEDILEKLEKFFDYAEIKFDRAFFSRFDVRFPQEYNGSTENKIRPFLSTFNKYLKRQGRNPIYFGVREQSREKHAHFHFVLFLDGRTTQSIYQVFSIAEKLWRRQIDWPSGKGLIDYCEKSRNGEKQDNGCMLFRNAPDYLEKRKACFYRASYLAKSNTKGYAPRHFREVFLSRIRERNM